MSFVRIIAALLLALALLAGAFAGFWLVALRYAEAALTRKLGEDLGATMTYGVPRWQPDLKQVHVKLPDVEMRLVPAGTRDTVTIKAPEIELLSAFFDQDRRFQVRLPQELLVTWTQANGVTQQYRVRTEQGELTFMQAKGVPSFILRATTARVDDMAQGQVLVQMTDAYLGWLAAQGERLANAAGARRLELAAKNVSGVVAPLKGGVIRADLNAMPELPGAVVQLMRDRDTAAFDRWLQTWVRWLRRGGMIDLQHGMVQLQDANAVHELAMFGQLSADNSGRPKGEVSLAASDGAWLAGVIGNSGLLQPGGIEEMFRRSQVLDRLALMGSSGAEVQVGVLMYQGMVIMNTQRVGPVNTFEDIIKQW